MCPSKDPIRRVNVTLCTRVYMEPAREWLMEFAVIHLVVWRAGKYIKSASFLSPQLVDMYLTDCWAVIFVRSEVSLEYFAWQLYLQIFTARIRAVYIIYSSRSRGPTEPERNTFPVFYIIVISQFGVPIVYAIYKTD